MAKKITVRVKAISTDGHKRVIQDFGHGHVKPTPSDMAEYFGSVFNGTPAMKSRACWLLFLHLKKLIIESNGIAYHVEVE